jgi:S-adenosylmethionine decarboxylase
MAKHIKILGKTSNEVISDEDLLKYLVDDIISEIGMRPIAETLSVNVPLAIEKLGQEPFEDEGGISVIRMLSTSHIAIHTWPLRNEFHLDIYSCREFNPKRVLVVLDNYMTLSQHKITDCSHGCKW